MQILIPDSWLREYLETNATPKQIQEALSLCGPSVERLHKNGDEYIYDIEVTTNRVDMMSVVGIAFECVAILPRFGYKASLKKNPYTKQSNLSTAKKVEYLTVKVDKELCQRFSAVLIKDVQVDKSPESLVKRLELVGLRSLNNVVDISNYLMWEMGQPVHTFDYDKISKSEMILRESKKNEKITTLDQKEFTLPGGDIIIEDGSGKLIDLAGIMGGLNSSVDGNTKNVLLFVQVYDPLHIRRTSMTLAQRTHAAVLFEKELPVENVLPTLELGIELFEKLTKGKAVNQVLDILNIAEGNSILKLKTPLTEFVNKRLGIELKYTEISKILKSLEFGVKSETEIEIPWARKHDVTIAEDLVEEIARLYGYHNLPTQLMAGQIPTLRDNKSFAWETKIKYWLSDWGFTESYTYSLIPEPTKIKLKNPLSSEWTYLRSDLASSHLKTIKENLGKIPEINLFEIANVYLYQKGQLPKEELHLVISSSSPNQLRLKGIVEVLEARMGTKISYVPGTGFVEIKLDEAIKKATGIKKYVPISKFPPIIEDVNIHLNGDYQSLVDKIKKISPLIKTIEFIDKYEDKLTLRITYHSDSKQLSSDDIAPIRSRLETLT